MLLLRLTANLYENSQLTHSISESEELAPYKPNLDQTTDELTLPLVYYVDIEKWDLDRTISPCLERGNYFDEILFNIMTINIDCIIRLRLERNEEIKTFSNEDYLEEFLKEAYRYCNFYTYKRYADSKSYNEEGISNLFDYIRLWFLNSKNFIIKFFKQKLKFCENTNQKHRIKNSIKKMENYELDFDILEFFFIENLCINAKKISDRDLNGEEIRKFFLEMYEKFEI